MTDVSARSKAAMTELADAGGATLSAARTSELHEKRAGADHPMPARRFGPAAARTVILLATDISGLLMSGAIGYLIWASPVHGQSAGLYLELLPLLLVFVIGYGNAGLYPGFGLGPVEILRRCTVVTGTGLAILGVISFAFKVPHLYSRVTLAIAGILALVLVPLGRAIIVRLTHGWRFWKEPVVIIGTGPRSRRAIEVLRAPGSLGYRPASVIALEPCAESHVGGVPVLGGPEIVPRLADQGMRVALAEAEDGAGVQLDWLRQYFPRVMTIRELDDLPVEGLEIRNLGGVAAIEYTNNLLTWRNRIVKRSMDLVLVTFGLLLALPIIVLSAAAVKLVSAGPAFFIQDRIGKRGRVFAAPKIRTMHQRAAYDLAQEVLAEPGLQTEWQENFKLRRDPRVIFVVGQFLRRFSLDELPQLWSVIKGEMSLVGPRPLPPYHLAAFPEPFRRLRQRVRPGLTGLWQVNARGNGSPAAYIALDTHYIQNWSPWLDVYILTKTVWAVLSGRGAY